MIPASVKGYVEYTDDDGVTWRYKPKCGDTEDALIAYIANKEAPNDAATNSRKFLDSILIGWTDPKSRLPPFPVSNPSSIFTTEERGRLFTYWHKANALSEDEKKT